MIVELLQPLLVGLVGKPLQPLLLLFLQPLFMPSLRLRLLQPCPDGCLPFGPHPVATLLSLLLQLRCVLLRLLILIPLPLVPLLSPRCCRELPSLQQ